MRFIRFDSVGGASGDMILSALTGLGVPSEVLKKQLSSFLPDSFALQLEETSSHGLYGQKLTVQIPPKNKDGDHSPHHSHHHEEEHVEHSHSHSHYSHQHRSFSMIREMIDSSALEQKVKDRAIGIFRLLAEAEGAVHHKNAAEVNFHEVGAVDSIVDIVGAAIGLTYLQVDQIAIGPLPVGCGVVECAHGTIPVPAPATVEILKTGGLEITPDGEPVEMLTPTAAAILTYLPKVSTLENYRILRSVNAFGHRKMIHRPNLLRASLCETIETESDTQNDYTTDHLIQLDCNIDDTSGEILAVAARECFKTGVLDVWITPILMKKGRPAQMISALLPPERREAILELLFRTTGTFGIRETKVTRPSLARTVVSVETKYGPISMKLGWMNNEVITAAPEFESVLQAAEKYKVSPIEVFEEAKTSYRSSRPLQ